MTTSGTFACYVIQCSAIECKATAASKTIKIFSSIVSPKADYVVCVMVCLFMSNGHSVEDCLSLVKYCCLESKLISFWSAVSTNRCKIHLVSSRQLLVNIAQTLS